MSRTDLIDAASFLPLSLKAPEAWCGHLPFSAWLIKTQAPKIFVELGTHSGNSYFSFCQAAHEASLSTKCYAVDTWQGDEHAGNYGDEIFNQVDTHNQAHYADFSRLLRMRFDDAVSYFSDSSIELLHIDGLHTYEAVKHDFETWLPKLAPGAIVLFHDTNVKERGFGVWRLWEELQARYPLNLEFLHSHGLGVLQLDNTSDKNKQPWLDLGLEEQQQLKNYFSSLGARQLERFELGKIKKQIATLTAEQHHLHQGVKDRDSQLATLNDSLIHRCQQIDALTAQHDQAVQKFNESAKAFNAATLEHDTRTAALTNALSERQELISKLTYEVETLTTSTSWKITAPLRFVAYQLKRIPYFLRVLPRVIQRGGGIRGTISKTIIALRYEGMAGIGRRLQLVANTQASTTLDPSGQPLDGNDYGEWIRRYDTLDDAARARIFGRIQNMRYRPKMSIIMPVFDPPLKFLDEAIWSVRKQLYPEWELCIADDASQNMMVRDLLKRHSEEEPRIKVVFRAENGHISKASNSALEIATGEFIAMLDHDDRISEHALYLVAESLNLNPDLDFLYSDQDKIDTSGVRYDPYFKPDFNPDLLRSQNYVDHLAVFRAAVVRALGGWRTEFDGSQDYDLVLRVTERLSPSRINHIPYVLYHWRAVPGSLASDAGAKNYAPQRSREALAEHIKRMGIEAEVTSHYPHLSIHRVIYSLPEEQLVSIIIPTKDGVDILRQCIYGLFHKTNYKNFEIIIVDNQSKKPETRQYLQELSRDSRVKIINYDKPFNYSQINNAAVREAKGSILAFLNNDIEVINSDWLREMVSHAVRPEIGVVGARLYYPDNTVQHAGVLLGYNGKAGHMYRYSPRQWLGYWARAVLIQNLTAVTAACMVVRREVFDAVKGFDEENLTVTFNDVDICLRIYEKGYRNLYTPYAELYHHESKTRGLLAFQSEEDYFARKWEPQLKNDPAYNPNLSLTEENFSLSFPPRISLPWVRHHITPGADDAPLVTIITRTHGNRQELLKEAINSIFQQTYRPIQVVIVEDGDDQARGIVSALTPPNGITLVYESVPKRGRCYAGNRGLELAQGEVFGFLDDDDLLLPDHVESLVRHLYTHQFAIGAYSSSLEVPTELIRLSPLQYKEGDTKIRGKTPFSLPELWRYNYIAIQSFLFKRELYLQYGGFYEELECLEDWDLWLRYTAEKDVVFLDKTTSKFRMPMNEASLFERRKQHMEHLPELRNRQKSLLRHYEGSPHYRRLKGAFDSVKI